MIRSLSPVAALLLKAMPRKHLSWCLGRLADVGAPGALLDPLVAQYIRVFDVDMSEVDETGQFANFDAFFTRKLRQGTRPIDSSEKVIVSPADGRLEDYGEITEDLVLSAKGRRYRVEELLAGVGDLGPYRGGQFGTIYLSPRDYHRVHAPIDGTVEKIVHIPGTLFPVNSIGVTHVHKLFARNERVAFVHSSAEGPLCSLMIGAIGVGRITTSLGPLQTNRGVAPSRPKTHACEARLNKGDELGVFHLGSTVILFLSRKRASGLQWLQPMGAQLRMGQALLGPIPPNREEGAA